MKTSRIIAVLALLMVAGAARAEPFLRGNQVDDFGPFHYTNPTPPPDRPIIATHASPVPANQIDDFGPLPEGYVANEELGAASAEPGAEVKASERAQEKAALLAYAHERFLQEVWRAAP